MHSEGKNHINKLNYENDFVRENLNIIIYEMTEWYDKTGWFTAILLWNLQWVLLDFEI